MPFVSPVHTAAVPVSTQEAPEGDDVTVYPVIADPPLSEGADQSITARAFPPVAVTLVGEPGTEKLAKSKSIAY